MDVSDPQLASPSKHALGGVRVIELGTFLSAPFAATLLADFGADVIKIELPGVGDPMRTLGAFPPDGQSGYWWSQIARNKRSVALDIRTPEGRDILGKLVRSADVLIENFRPGTLDRWGITTDWLAEHRSDLIVVRISGYGQDGPWRDVPGFDRNAQAFSGLVYVTGEADGPPQQAGYPVCDFSAGLWAAFGAVTALLGKLRSGDPGGNEVDLALYESMLPFSKDIPMKYRHQAEVSERSGNTPDYVSPGGAYLTGDEEWIFVSGTGDRVFKRLMDAIGRSDLAERPELQLNRDRVKNRKLIDGAIRGWLEQRATDEILKVFASFDVPAVKVQSIADLMQHPQVVARGNFVDVPEPAGGETCHVTPIPKLAQMPAAIRWPGQDLGEATIEVLQGELNLPDEVIAKLRQRGVVG